MISSNRDIEFRDLDIKLSEKLKNIPTKPGVYLHKNENGKIIYIGKAKNLRNRVKSYFQQKKPVDAKTKAMVEKIADFDFIVVDSEAEALILEDTLIKKYKPRYNILLKDDKSYPYIRVTKEDYPRIFSTRKIIKDGSKYFGPYTDVGYMKKMLRVLRSIFLIRSCKYNLNDENILKKKFKLCLDYHIKKCDGPCEGLISREEYNNKIKLAIQVLNGKTSEVKKFLKNEMQKLADEFKFEEAEIIKQRYLVLNDFIEHQKIITTDLIDRDIFGIARIENDVCTLVLKIRDGKLIGKRHFIIPKAKDESNNKILQATIDKLYLESEYIPDEIVLPIEPNEIDFIKHLLMQKKNSKIEISFPKIGDKKKLVNMANTNAEYILREYHISLLKREQSVPRVVQSLQRDLKLNKLPRHIECFDNSHIQGSELVSSCVVFKDGKPSKNEYRKFKIKSVFQNDDFAAMREVIQRRYQRLINENQPLPDLIIVDGGKGQLSSAVKILKELNIYNKINIIGLAKRLEEIYFPNHSEPLQIPKTSSSLQLIQRIRDEAHRFAITFHRDLREKRTLRSELTEIKGIGEKLANKLLITFESVDKIKTLTIEDLKQCVNTKVAENIYDYFHKD